MANLRYQLAVSIIIRDLLSSGPKAPAAPIMNKKSLQQRLASLLGVDTDDDENYVSDILESLIAIGDNPDDVADYLSSFVVVSSNDDGNEEVVRQFSMDVQKFKMGETVSTATVKSSGMQNSSKSGGTQRQILDEAAAQREATKRNEKQKQKEKRLTDLKKKEVEDEQRRLWEEAVAAKSKTSTGGMRHDQSVTCRTTSLLSDSAQNTSTKIAMSSSQTSKDVGDNTSRVGIQTDQRKVGHLPAKPPKGTPKNKPCGCYGNMHQPLKNCLSCGRISCELEGINDYCHFCGCFIGEDNYYYYNDHDGNNAKLEMATRHKEKLLEFDRTSASRTQILDDQEDYFVAATSVWNTDQEQGEYHAMEEERRKKVHDRQRNVISFK